MNYPSFGLLYQDLVLSRSLENMNETVGIVIDGKPHNVPCCLFLFKGDWYEVNADSQVSALTRANLEYKEHNEQAFQIEATKNRLALRLVNDKSPNHLYIYQSKKPKSQWRLSEVLRYRHLKYQDLTSHLDVSSATFSRWRSSLFIPPIGGDNILRLCDAITKASNSIFPSVEISDLISVS